MQALLSELTCGCSDIQQTLFEQCTNSVFGELKSFGTTYYRHNQFRISQLPMIKHEIYKVIHVVFVCYTHILQKINNNNDDGGNLFIYQKSASSAVWHNILPPGHWVQAIQSHYWLVINLIHYMHCQPSHFNPQRFKISLLSICSLQMYSSVIIFGTCQQTIFTILDNFTVRSEEHTSELQSRETISYAVFCLKKKKKKKK